MCFICQVVGRNIFEDQSGIDHDPEDTGGGVEIGPSLYYVWRRSDGCVMTTNMHPEEIFDGTYGYYVLPPTGDAHQAAWDAAWLTACN